MRYRFVIATACDVNATRFAPNLYAYDDKDSWDAWKDFFDLVRKSTPVIVRDMESGNSVTFEDGEFIYR